MEEDQFVPKEDAVVEFGLSQSAAAVELVHFAERCFKMRPDGQLAQKIARQEVEEKDLLEVEHHQEASASVQSEQPFMGEAELRHVEVDAVLLDSVFVDDPDEPSDQVVGSALEQN